MVAVAVWLLVRIEDEASVATPYAVWAWTRSPSTLGGRLLAEQAVKLTESQSQTPMIGSING